MGEADGTKPTAAVWASRVQGQARDHWHEFSVIVASANTLLAVVLVGRIFTVERSALVYVLASLVAVAAGAAAMLAYYTIQMGALFVFGPLRLGDVLTSFLIAATQLALFLWPTHVLGAQSDGGIVRGLRHWLLFYIAFVLAGALANRNAARVRNERRAPVHRPYEMQQRSGVWLAVASAGIILVCWALSLWSPTIATFAGVLLGLPGTAYVMHLQDRLAAGLADEADFAALPRRSG